MKLIVKKERYGLSGWGRLFLFMGVVGLGTLMLFGAYPFLAPQNPVKGQALIVEGWMPDHALKAVQQRFQKENYSVLLTTGGPLSAGSFLSHYKSYAALAKASLLTLDIPPEKIVALPAPQVERNRTFTSALEAKKWLQTHPEITQVNLISLGVHARRSFWLFRQALPESVELGVISIPSEDYASERWWTSSAGVRAVFFESLACTFHLFNTYFL